MHQLPGGILFIVAIIDRILQKTEKLGFPLDVVLPPKFGFTVKSNTSYDAYIILQR